MKRIALAAGFVLLLLCGSIVHDLARGTDDRCDYCWQKMRVLYAMDLRDSRVVVYKCDNCDQRGQLTQWHDGRPDEWIEW